MPSHVFSRLTRHATRRAVLPVLGPQCINTTMRRVDDDDDDHDDDEVAFVVA
jgi:hypothetical protein